MFHACAACGNTCRRRKWSMWRWSGRQMPTRTAKPLGERVARNLKECRAGRLRPPRDRSERECVKPLRIRALLQRCHQRRKEQPALAAVVCGRKRLKPVSCFGRAECLKAWPDTKLLRQRFLLFFIWSFFLVSCFISSFFMSSFFMSSFFIESFLAFLLFAFF